MSAEFQELAHKLETQRDAMVKRFRKTLYLVVSGLILCKAVFPAEMDEYVAMLFVGALIWAVFYKFSSNVDRRSLAAVLRRHMVRTALSSVAPGLRYSERGWSAAYVNSLDVLSPPDVFYSQDSFSGKFENTQFCFSFVSLSDIEITEHKDKDGHTTTTETEVEYFKGLVFVADFKKPMSGRTLVQSTRGNRYGSNVLPFESAAFNQQFAVCSANNTEARYVLTPRLMERISALANRFSGANVTFRDSLIAISLPLGSMDQFYVDANAPFTNPVLLQKAKSTLTAILLLVHDLDLETLNARYSSAGASQRLSA